MNTLNFLQKKFDACDQASLQSKGAGRHPVAIPSVIPAALSSAEGTKTC